MTSSLIKQGTNGLKKKGTPARAKRFDKLFQSMRAFSGANIMTHHNIIASNFKLSSP